MSRAFAVDRLVHETRRRRVRASRLRVFVRRSVLLCLVVATVWLLTTWMAELLHANGFSMLEHAILVLFVVLSIVLAFGFWTVVAGFMVETTGRDPLAVTAILDGRRSNAPLGARTAVVMPIHNEDARRVAAGLLATYESLERTGWLSAFDFFVLSDTTDPRVWIEEELEFERLRGRVSWPERLHYWKRRHNVERKAGNIAEFCRRFGRGYRYMVVLDADSVMAGRCIVDLVRIMEARPDVGIVQAPPLPVNRRTLFGRLQQFASRAYGPTFGAGLGFWQGGEGNYYGHNAILRIRPFVAHCRLPRLSGKEPLGGSILSHDFVEAALMRRAGFKVYVASGLSGSYEEPPPSVIDHAIRDRRWCQGNLQHARLLGMPGLETMSRLNLAMGVMAYLASPLWMLMLLLATGEAARQEFATHDYFASGPLFPTWKVSIQQQAGLLFATVMTMLFLPKAMALLSRLRERGIGRFGGRLRLAGSVLAEALFSVLLSPVHAFFQTRFVLDVLRGRSVGWAAQERGDRGTSFREALLRHGGTTAIGLAWAAATATFVPDLFPWLLPVLIGPILSIPLSIWTSRPSAGQAFRERGIFVTPEEAEPPFVLRRLREELAAAAARPPADPRPALARVIASPALRALHRSLLPPAAQADPLERHRLGGLVLKAQLAGVASLSRDEERDLLFAPELLDELAAVVRSA